MRPTSSALLVLPLKKRPLPYEKNAPSNKPVTPEAPTGPLDELVALRRRAHEQRGIAERRDDAAVATVVQGLKKSLDPDEGVQLIHDAIEGQTEARQANILAECATQLRSLRALPIVRQKALIALLAAAEKIQSERPAALEAAVIALTAEGSLGGQRFKALIDRARALPDEHRGKTIATIGAQLLRVDARVNRELQNRTSLFLETAAEVETHRPEFLESLVEAAQKCRQAFAYGERDLLDRARLPHTALALAAAAEVETHRLREPLELLVEAEQGGGQALVHRAQDLPAPAMGRAAASLASLVIAERKGKELFQLEKELLAADRGLHAMWQEASLKAIREGRQALLAREQNLLAEGGNLHTSLLEGRISCREIAAEHGIVVDHLHKLAWSSAESRVRGGENLVDVLQTVDFDIGLRMKLNDIALDHARHAIHKGEKPSRVIERLGIHDHRDIAQLIETPVWQLRDLGITTVEGIVKRLDFPDPRYARLAAKYVEDIIRPEPAP